MAQFKDASIEDTVYFWFGANDTSGSGGDGASAAAAVRLAGAAASAAPVLSPTPSLLSDAGYPAGCYEVAVAATTANGFASGNEYAVFCTLAIDSQNPTGFVGSFWLAAANDKLHDAAERIMDISNATEIQADVAKISTDATAANNAESFFDGTGYAGTGNTIPTVTTVTNQVTADVTAISGDGPAADNAELFFDNTGFNASASTIGTTTTNTDMRGTDNAALASVATEARLAELDAGNVPGDIDAILIDTGTDGVKLSTAAISTTTFAAGAIDAAAIAADAIGASEIANGAIDAATFAAGAIDAAAIATDAIDADALAADASAEIADAVWDESSAGHTDAGKAGEQLWTDVDAILVDTGTDGVKLSTAAISTTTFAAGAIDAAAIATDAIGAAEIADNAIDAGAIANDAITAAKIADGAIDAATFAAGAIDAAAIATNAIDADALAADAVTEIQSGLATAAALTTVDANVDAILVDTGTDGVKLSTAAISTTTFAASAIDAAALAADAGTEIAAAVGARLPSAGEDTSAHGSYDWILARLGLVHRQTVTDDGDSTATGVLYKADGTTQWGSNFGATTAASSDIVTGAEDTAT